MNTWLSCDLMASNNRKKIHYMLDCSWCWMKDLVLNMFQVVFFIDKHSWCYWSLVFRMDCFAVGIVIRTRELLEKMPRLYQLWYKAVGILVNMPAEPEKIVFTDYTRMLLWYGLSIFNEVCCLISQKVSC